MGKKVDLSGRKFSRVLVLNDTGKRTANQKILYSCLCDCGNKFEVRGGNLVSGNTRSCGCLQKEEAANKLRTHGKSKTVEYEINRRLEKNYGITVEDLDNLYKSQNYLCAICGVKEDNNPNYSFNIDHCHKTGKVRGLLCRQCNWGLGQFRDNINILKKAISYLEKEIIKPS